MRVAIHQPNFIPWLGLFHRIAMVDRFVIFDHVPAMGGRSWLSRNKLLIAGEARWVTLPVRKSGRLGQLVREVEIDHDHDLGRKHMRSLEVNYAKRPHAAPVLTLMAELYGAQYGTIAEFNGRFITSVAGMLGLGADFVSSSALAGDDPDLMRLAGNDLVIATCRAAGGDEYVSGDGCLDFIRPDAFEAQGVRFYFQKFVHPQYAQSGAPSFVSHLSVIDALCNLGAAGVRALIDRPSLVRPAALAAADDHA